MSRNTPANRKAASLKIAQKKKKEKEAVANRKAALKAIVTQMNKKE
ncbi:MULTISPECIES: hypothetical protein [Myroides]|nr:hypothetical protein [Myroides phaeus]